MKTVKFRPLRFVKKTGKITVSSYMLWRKVLTADYKKFILKISDEHKELDPNSLVHDHKGEPLFFYDYNPAEVPVFQGHKLFDLESIQENNEQYGILWNHEDHVNYNMKGTDCDGIPAFSHYTSDYIATHFNDVTAFEPLTVGTVTKWYGWILWQLNNSYLDSENICSL